MYAYVKRNPCIGKYRHDKTKAHNYKKLTATNKIEYHEKVIESKDTKEY
jgi:hypothetical protein